MEPKKVKPGMRCHRDEGFILPLAVLLVIVLTISGMGFMQHDYLERRMVVNNVDNHDAFYLANAGIERGRETFKIVTGTTAPSWSSILNGSDGLLDARYPTDKTYPADLCPFGAAKGCVIPPFQTTRTDNPTTGNPLITTKGAAVAPPDMPTTGLFPGAPAGTVFYSVRAYNDNVAGETATVDQNAILIFRARGFVQNEQKLLELAVKATSKLDLINCHGNETDPCPDIVNGNPPISNLDGRDPSSHPDLPTLKFPLATPFNPDPKLNTYYRFDFVPTHFTDYSPGPLAIQTCLPGGGIDCTDPAHIKIDAANNTFYLIDVPNGKVTVDFTSANPLDKTRNRVVIYALGGSGGTVIVDAQSAKQFNNSIIIGQGDIQLKHGTIRAPLPMPAVIAEGNVDSGNSDTFVYGTIFATTDPIPSGLVNVNPVKVHGVIIGDLVEIQGSSTYSDDGNIDYYTPMPGFTYPDDLLTTVSVGPGSWKEIE